MTTIYELVGRLVVRLAWKRFGRQIQATGIVFAVLAIIAGYLIARREPPEG